MKKFKLGLVSFVILGWVALFAEILKAIGTIPENPFSRGPGNWVFVTLALPGLFLTVLGFVTRPKEMIQMIKRLLFG